MNIPLMEGSNRSNIAEQELRKSEEKYRDLFENVNDAIVVLNEAHEIEDFNAAFEHLMECDAKELAGLKIPELVLDQDKNTSASFFKKLKKEGYYKNYEGRIRTFKGNIKHVQVNSTAIYKDGKFAGSRDIVRDVTEQKELENRYSQAHSAIESSLNAVFTADLKGNVTYANKAAAQLWGYKTVHEMISEKPHVFNYWTSGSREKAIEIINHLENYGNYKGEEGLKGLGKNGSEFDVEVLANVILDNKANPIGITGSFNDITERKRTEKALRESEQQYRAIFENTAVHIFTVDKKGIIRSLNHPTPGLKQEDVVGSNIFDFQPNEEETEKARTALKRVFTKGESITYETHITHPDLPQGFYYYNSVSPLIIEGKVKMATFIAQDITKQKYAEQALKESRERMKAILSSVPDLIFRVSNQGVFLDYQANDQASLYVSPEQFINKNILKVLPDTAPDKLASTILKKIVKAITSNILVIHEYQLPINAELKDYEARIVRSGNNEALIMIRDITQQAKAKQQLLDYQEKLSELAQSIEAAREEEKRNISLEIHDVLGQELTAIKMGLFVLQRKLQSTSIKEEYIKEMVKKTQSLIEQTDKVLEDVRRISHELRPTVLDDLGLIPGMEWVLANFEQDHKIRTIFLKNIPENDILFKPDFSIAIYRILQEALTNVLRHANASKIDVKFNKKKADIYLEIKDNGVGINLNKIKDQKSIGLVGMSERIKKWNGAMQIINKKGTILSFQFPITLITLNEEYE